MSIVAVEVIPFQARTDASGRKIYSKVRPATMEDLPVEEADGVLSWTYYSDAPARFGVRLFA